MPDLEVVRKHLNALVSNYVGLKKHLPVTAQRLQQNSDLRWILERGLYLCIQNLLDSLTHIISADFNEQWDSYSDVTAILRRRDILTHDQEQTLNKMIGLRNRLSHDYLSLNPEILVDVASNRLDDFLTFAGIIARYCKIEVPNPQQKN
jgi:uncharacterized protein YutE (UPF0331/DUF86 family)